MEPYNKLANSPGETRSVTTSDIKELSNKPSGKDAAINKSVEAKAADVKDAIVDKAEDVKNAVVDKAMEVKDVVVEKTIDVADAAAEKYDDAKEVVSEALDSAGDIAARIARATGRFASANALPLTLVSVSAGWMIINARRQPETKAGVRHMGASRARGRADRDGRDGASARDVTPRTIEGSTLAVASEWRSETHDMIANGKNTAARGARVARDGFKRAQEASRDFAKANPLTLAMGALALGMGIGLLLPASERENKLLQPTRTSFDRLMGGARDIASDVVDVAKETANEVIAAT